MSVERDKNQYRIALNGKRLKTYNAFDYPKC